MSLIQDDCSDAALRDIISDDLVPERNKGGRPRDVAAAPSWGA